MIKKIYAINSKTSPSLCFYLIANQKDFNIIQILSNISYDSIVIDVYEDESLSPTNDYIITMPSWDEVPF